MKVLSRWYKKKMELSYYHLKTEIDATEEYKVLTGGKYIYGKVSLSAKPNDKFAFKSLVKWPDQDSSSVYEEMVINGIIDVLFSHTHTPILGVSVSLSDIGWHEINSCAIGYYYATRKATEHLIRPAKSVWNYE